jgi:hypothetical protein
MKGRWALVCALVAAAVVVAAANLALAEEPQPQAQGEVVAQAMLGSAFTYQGQLKKDGNPVTATCDFRFTLWDALSGGSQVGTTQEKAGVSVSGGFFTIADLDFGTTAFEGDERFLEIAVKCAGDADYIALSPRQLITATPYALSLRPGAKVSGGGMSAELATTQLLSISPLRFALIGVRGEGTWGVLGYSDSSVGVRGVAGASGATTGTGVFGLAQPTSGTTYGVYGKAQSPGGYGGYFENAAAGGTALYADGKFQSSAVSRVFVPATHAVEGGRSLPNDSCLRFTYWGRGTVAVKAACSTPSAYTVVLPAAVPAILYGQPVRVQDLRVHYSTSNARSYITETNLYREKLDGSYYELLKDTTDRTSTTFTYYDLECNSDYCRLGDEEGFIAVRLQLYFADAADTISLGGVRLTLKHE